MNGIYIKEFDLGYLDVPKNGSTSIKEYLYQSLYAKAYNAKENNMLNRHQFFHKYYGNIDLAKYRMIILRDPVKRFLSVYSNRVVFYKELSQEHLQKSEQGRQILEKNLTCTPNLHEFITNFLEYKREPSLWHHTKPIYYILSTAELNSAVFRNIFYEL